MSDEPIKIFLLWQYAVDFGTYTDDAFTKIMRAVNQQLQQDLAPLWPRTQMPEVIYDYVGGVSAGFDEIDFIHHPNWWPVYFHPGNQALWDAGIKGFHGTTRRVISDDERGRSALNLPANINRIKTDDRPYACVVTFSDATTPRDLFTDVSQAVSREIMQMIINPRLDHTAGAPLMGFEFGANMFDGVLTVDGAPFMSINAAVEVCDPVQNDSYIIAIEGQDVTVCNAVSEDWFNWEYANFLLSDGGFPVPTLPFLSLAAPLPTEVKWDIMETTTGPWQISLESEGNAIGFLAAGTTQLGDELTMPDYLHPVLGPYVPLTAPLTAATPGGSEARVAKELYASNLDYVFATVNNFPALTADDDLIRFTLESGMPLTAPTP